MATDGRIRVCHLIDANVATAYFAALAQHHDSDRYELTIGSLASDGPLQSRMTELGVGTFSLGASGRASYGGTFGRLVGVLRERRVDLLHAHCFDPTALGIVAARLASVAVVYTRHHSDHNLRLGKRWHVAIDGWCGRRADHVIAVSNATKAVMVSAERVHAERITVVHNGMDPIPPIAPGAADAVRTELGLEGRQVCLVPARLHEEKGLFVLLAALPQVLASVPDLVVLLAGEGDERAAIETAVAAAGLGGHVRLLGQRPDIPALMLAADVVALPSLAESFGFAALEAMALGRPAVVSRLGGLPELIDDGVTGLLVAPGNPGALADALTRVLLDPLLAARLGDAARCVAPRFSASRMVAGYEAVYESVLLHRGRR